MGPTPELLELKVEGGGVLEPAPLVMLTMESWVMEFVYLRSGQWSATSVLWRSALQTGHPDAQLALGSREAWAQPGPFCRWAVRPLQSVESIWSFPELSHGWEV